MMQAGQNNSEGQFRTFFLLFGRKCRCRHFSHEEMLSLCFAFSCGAPLTGTGNVSNIREKKKTCIPILSLFLSLLTADFLFSPMLLNLSTRFFEQETRKIWPGPGCSYSSPGNSRKKQGTINKQQDTKKRENYENSRTNSKTPIKKHLFLVQYFLSCAC